MKRIAIMLAVASIPSAASATSYKFTVSCSNRDRLVVEWRTGEIDPGREALRVSTGSNYPNCSVRNYNESTDSDLRVEVKQGGSAVVQGIPLIGEALKEVPIVGDIIEGVGGLFD